MKKSSLSADTIALAQRYEKAWHKFYYQMPRWKQKEIIEQPYSRVADELAKQVRIYVDTNEDLKD